MFLFFWVLLRVTLIIGTVFGLPLFLAIRAMAREFRKDQALSGKPKSGGIRDANWHLAGVAILMVLILGARRHQWGAAMTGCAIVLGIFAFTRLEALFDTAISRSLADFVDRGPATDSLWLRAAGPVCAILLLDTFITGEWRLSPGLAFALIWCLSWGLLTRLFRRRAELRAHS